MLLVDLRVMDATTKKIQFLKEFEFYWHTVYNDDDDDDDDNNHHVGNDRTSELHSGLGAVSTHAERPVLSYGREESVLAGHHSADIGRSLQQPRDHPDVLVPQSDHRPTSPHFLPVCRLRHQTSTL